MGVRGLLKRMQDAGFGSSPTEIARLGGSTQEAILDGPNLVFHIAQQLLDQDRCVNATIWLQSSYADIVRSVIDFLQMLEDHGLAISAIYFDGALPLSKIDVRLGRLQRYVDALSAYHALHQETSKTAHRKKTEASKLWTSSPLERARRVLPGLPFLVPAVVEGLLESRYAEVTHLVPGEADAFCVAAARSIYETTPRKNIVIFSNDSDLLIYECGPSTRIVLLSGLQSSHDDSTVEQLIGINFCPAAIAKSFGKKDLIEIAYHMHRDNTVTVNWVVQLMKQGDYTIGEDFAQFRKTYDIEQEITDLHWFPNDAKARLTLVNLDARVSELIHFVKSKFENTAQQVSMFLPFLQEDPSKKTAWNIGQQTRLIAYKLITLAYNPSLSELYEHKRSGRKISAQTITQAEMSDENIETWSLQLSTCIQGEKGIQQSQLGNEQRWRYVVMQLVLLDMAHEDMALPSQQNVVAILKGHSVDSWELFHLSAQFQASYYSLRMLLQIWQYVEDDSVLQSRLPREWKARMQAPMRDLEYFPSISKFFEPDTSTSIQMTWDPLVDTLMKRLGLELGHSSLTDTTSSRKGKKRKKKKGDEEDLGTKWKRKMSSNPFAALDGMS